MISVDRIDKAKLYWLFQIIGWSIFFIVHSFIWVSFLEFNWKVFASYFNLAITGLLITHFYRVYIKRTNWSSYSIFFLSLRVLLASMIIGLLWNLITFPINYTFFLINKEQDSVYFLFALLTVNLTFSIFVWSLIYFSFHLFINFKRTEVEKWKLEAAVKDAELIALKSQVNPHFIFNSLNNIRSLVVENPEKARDMITHLSGLLRYSIQFSTLEKVSLESELEIVQNYLNLESIQFEDRLQYKLEIKPETLDLQIPPMAVQLLVENAIKHGISDLPEGGMINIKSYLDGEQLIVEVINSGQLKVSTSSTGIGLKNASDRLKLLFGKLSDLRIINIDDEYVSAKFTIPLN